MRKPNQVIGAHNQDFRTIPELWPDVRGRHVLDLGCGSGLYTYELARRGAIAIGIDLDRKSLSKARTERGEGRHCFVCADAAHLPFRDGAFHMAVSVEVLTHIPPLLCQDVLAEVARVLSQGGRVYLTLHNSRRSTLSQWLRLRRRREKYLTANLDVWPLEPARAREMLRCRALNPIPPCRYLNYHSRFSHAFHCAHPHLSKMVILLEELLSDLPLLRRLGITFLLVAEKAPSGTSAA